MVCRCMALHWPHRIIAKVVKTMYTHHVHQIYTVANDALGNVPCWGALENIKGYAAVHMWRPPVLRSAFYVRTHVSTVHCAVMAHMGFQLHSNKLTAVNCAYKWFAGISFDHAHGQGTCQLGAPSTYWQVYVPFFVLNRAWESAALTIEIPADRAWDKTNWQAQAFLSLKCTVMIAGIFGNAQD